MALSYINYPADGSTTQFDITFGYLRRTHVFVFVDNSLVGFKWISSTRIEISPAPPLEAEVRIQRLTDKVNRITDFADGQTLLAGDLDAATLQNFYLAQEMLDGITDGVLQGDVVLNQPLVGGEPLTIQEVQGILNEAARNSPVVLQLLGDVSGNTQSIFTETQERLAAVTAETQARIAAIAAEAQSRQDALSAEAQARLDALNALQAQIDADVASLAATSAALTQEIADRISAVGGVTAGLSQEITDRAAAVQANADALAQEALDRQGGDQALDTRIDAVVATVDGNSALIASEQTARIFGDDALASQISVVQAATDGNSAQIAAEQTARINADTSFATSLTALTTRMGDAEAGLISVNEAVSTETSARVTAISGLQTSLNANSALIASNSTAISDETSARASAVAALQAQVDGNASAITTEQSVRASADSAFTLSLSALTARVGDNEADIITVNEAVSTEASARATAISGLQAQVNGANALIAANQTAISDEAGARASETSQLFARANQGSSQTLTKITDAFDGFSSNIGRTVVAAASNVASIVTDADKGSVIEINSLGVGGVSIWMFERMPIRPEGKYRASAWFKQITVQSPGTSVALVNLEAMDASGAVVGNRRNFVSATTLTLADGWKEFVTAAYTGADLTGTWPTAQFVSMSVTLCREASERMRVASMRLEDFGNLAAVEADVEAQIVSEASARASADTAIASDVSGLTTRVGDAEAAIVSNQTAISNETSARASAVSGLQTQINGNAAAITSEQTARVNADNVIASAVSGLTARMGDAEAGIVSVSEAVTDEESARTSQVNALTARMDKRAMADLADGIEAFTRSTTGAPGTGSPASRDWDEVSVAGVGTVFRLKAGSGFRELSSHSVVPAAGGRKYRLKARLRVIQDATNGGGTSCAVRFRALDENFNGLTYLAVWGGAHLTAADGWVDIESETTTYAGAAHLRMQLYVNWRSEKPVVGDAIYEVSELQVEDVAYTDARVVSEASARASADSAIASDVSGLTTRMGDAEADVLSNATAISDEEGARVADVSVLRAGLRGSGFDRFNFVSGFSDWVGYFTGNPEDTPSSPESQSWTLESSGAEGSYASIVPASAFRYLSPRPVYTWEQGKRFKLTVVARYNGTTGLNENALSALLRGLSGSYAATPQTVSGLEGAHFQFTETGTWHTFVREYVLPATTTSAFFRAGIYTRGDWTSSNGSVDVREMLFEEIGQVSREIEAAVVSEASARASADSAIASDVSGLTTRMGAAEAGVISNAQAISDETSSRASEMTALTASMSPQALMYPSAGTWTNTASHHPQDTPDLTTVTEDADGAQVVDVAANTHAYPKQVFPIVPGRIYRVSVDVEPTGASGAVEIVAHSRVSNGSAVSPFWSHFNLGTITGRTRASATWGGPGTQGVERIWADSHGETSIRFGVKASSSSASPIRVYSVLVEDVTDGHSRQSAVEAQVVSEASARASADSAIASDVSGLTTRVGDAEADITTVQSVAADAQGRAQAIYGLRTNVNGHVVGFGLSNDGATGEFAILADKFLIVDPSNGSTVASPFSVIGGTTYITNARVGAAQIDSLSVNQLTAGSINVDFTLDGVMDIGQGKITFDNGVYMKVQGVAFGANNDLIEWYGPKMTIVACTKANAIMYADTAGNYHLGGGVTAEWASIQNVSVGTLDLASGAVGASTVLDTVATFDLYTGANANPVNASEFNTWTDTLPEVPIKVGDQLVVDFSYDIECQFNAFEFYNFLDTLSVRYHFANGSTTVAYPGDWVKKRFFACASNGAIPSISGAANYDVLESFQRKLVMTIPDAAPFNTAGAELEGVEVILSVAPYAQPGQSRAIHGGTYTGSKITGHLKLRDINAAATVFAAGPIATS